MIAMILIFNAATAGVATEPWTGFGGPDGTFVVRESLNVPPLDDRRILWRRDLGPGESQVLSHGRMLITQYSIPDPADKKKGVDVVVALDPANGKTIWEHRTPIAMRPKQETFRGAPIGPQASPALTADRVIALTFDGTLTALDAATGKPVWSRPLVDEFGATPVQFGFSGSPVVKGELVFVPAGGSHCGLIAFDLRDGTVRWKSPAAEPSYATPVLTEIHGHAVIVWITRDAVQIIDSSSGRLLGSEPLPKQKLTNVPQPLVIDGRRLIISAQGTDDIRAWDITPEFTFRERWKGTKPRFFYCNWLPTQGLVVGHGEGKFLALDPANGKILWEDLRLKDANLIADRDGNALILRGDGLLVSAKITREELIRKSELQLLKDRCWTPPTVREGILYVRNAREIVALKLRP